MKKKVVKLVKGPGPYPDCSAINTYADKKWTKFTPKVAVSYQANDDLLYYFKLFSRL